MLPDLNWFIRSWFYHLWGFTPKAPHVFWNPRKRPKGPSPTSVRLNDSLHYFLLSFTHFICHFLVLVWSWARAVGLLGNPTDLKIQWKVYRYLPFYMLNPACSYQYVFLKLSFFNSQPVKNNQQISYTMLYHTLFSHLGLKALRVCSRMTPHDSHDPTNDGWPFLWRAMFTTGILTSQYALSAPPT